MNGPVDPSSVSDWLGAAKTALELLKGARALFPQGQKRDELDASIGRAEEALARSDAALAKQLGYQLCQCSFPPRIMLWREGEGIHACPDPACGRKLQPAGPAPSVARQVPAARVCPLCEGEMKIVSEKPHPYFSFAGVKVHEMECSQCDNKTTRDFKPGDGYR